MNAKQTKSVMLNYSWMQCLSSFPKTNFDLLTLKFPMQHNLFYLSLRIENQPLVSDLFPLTHVETEALD